MEANGVCDCISIDCDDHRAHADARLYGWLSDCIHTALTLSTVYEKRYGHTCLNVFPTSRARRAGYGREYTQIGLRTTLTLSSMDACAVCVCFTVDLMTATERT